MIVDREDPRDVGSPQPSLRTQFTRHWRWQFLVSCLALVVISALGHLYVFRDGEIQLVPMLAIGTCYLIWIAEAFFLSPRRIKKMCQRLVIPPSEQVRFYASDWTELALEFSRRARAVSLLLVPAVMVALRGKPHLSIPMFAPATLYIIDTLQLWKKLSW